MCCRIALKVLGFQISSDIYAHSQENNHQKQRSTHINLIVSLVVVI